MPVSVKTRIGFNEPETERWIGDLLEVNPAAFQADGIMVGRGIFSNPAFFADQLVRDPEERTLL